jgi:tRNA pseudouridine55 synthase
MYVRSLAYDLGQALGCGAHLAELRRLQTGPFHAESAVTLERLEEAYQEDTWPSLFYPPDYLVLHLKAVQLSDVEERQVRNGQPVPLAPRTHYSEHMEACRAYSTNGRFIALVRFNRPESLWYPFKVLELKEPSPYSVEKALT